MKALFCYSFLGKHEPSGMPNFYYKAILESRNNKTNTTNLTVDSLDHLFSHFIAIRLLAALNIKLNYQILKPFSLIFIILSAHKYRSIVFIGPTGLLISVILRFCGYRNKFSTILYDVTFIEKSNQTKSLARVKSLFTLLVLKFYYSNSKGQILVLCSSHLKVINNYQPKINANWFKYGVYTPFYLEQIKFREKSRFLPVKIHSLIQSRKYCISIGSAYRDNDLLRELSTSVEHTHRFFVSITIDKSMPPKSIIQQSNNLFNLYNFPPDEYLDLLFHSSSVLVLSSRPSSMAGLTTILECIAMKKRVFVTLLPYVADYSDKFYLNHLPAEPSSAHLFNDDLQSQPASPHLNLVSYQSQFYDQAKAFLELLHP